MAENVTEQKNEADKTTAPAAVPNPIEPGGVRFNQLYAEKEAERRAKESERQARLAIEQENARLKAQLEQAPRTSQPSAATDPDTAFVREAVKPELDRVAQMAEKVLHTQAIQSNRETAKSALDSFWAANPDYARLRDKVDREIMDAVNQGYALNQLASPDALLNHFLGEEARAGAEGRKATASSHVSQVSRLNAVADAEQGHSASPAATKDTDKKFEDMSTSEIEAKFGKRVIWKKGHTDPQSLDEAAEEI